jgi:hypothetical protein
MACASPALMLRSIALNAPPRESTAQSASATNTPSQKGIPKKTPLSAWVKVCVNPALAILITAKSAIQEEFALSATSPTGICSPTRTEELPVQPATMSMEASSTRKYRLSWTELPT